MGAVRRAVVGPITRSSAGPDHPVRRAAPSLEDQSAEVKAEVGKAQAPAAELKQKAEEAEEAEFSPLDAIMQMDPIRLIWGQAHQPGRIGNHRPKVERCATRAESGC